MAASKVSFEVDAYRRQQKVLSHQGQDALGLRMIVCSQGCINRLQKEYKALLKVKECFLS